MRLTDYEKAMLNGDHGEIRQQALQALYDLATFYDVDQFVDATEKHCQEYFLFHKMRLV